MNVEGHLGASFLASFGNAGGRRWDTDMLLIRLDRWIDKYIDGERRGEGGRDKDQEMSVKKEKWFGC